MGPDQNRDNTSIDNSQVRRPPDPEARVHNTSVLQRQHDTGPRVVIDGDQTLPRVRSPLLIGVHGVQARRVFRFEEVRQGRRLGYLAGVLGRLDRGAQVVLVGQVLRVDRRALADVGRVDVHGAHAQRPHPDGGDGDEVGAVEGVIHGGVGSETGVGEDNLGLRDRVVIEEGELGLVDHACRVVNGLFRQVDDG